MEWLLVVAGNRSSLFLFGPVIYDGSFVEMRHEYFHKCLVLGMYKIGIAVVFAGKGREKTMGETLV
jgi:hypothetical protein